MDKKEVLREYIRKFLTKLKKAQKQELRTKMYEERKIRRAIRKMLREKQDTVQYNSTGINALEKLLNSIVPILETGYKDLKTDISQRKSFRAHIVRAVQNLLSTASVFFSADKKMIGKNGAEPEILTAPLDQQTQELSEQELDVTLKNPEENPEFINIDKPKTDSDEKPDPMTAFKTLADEDLTGRNFALETFKKIQKQILETYSLLSNEQDREIFYDFLITNIKLYFDKFETELEATPEEPTTPEYEAEKEKMNAELAGAAPATGGEISQDLAAGTTPTEELPPEA